MRGVSGKDRLGNPINIGDLLLFPAAVGRAEAEVVVDEIIVKLNGSLTDGSKVEFSNIRYVGV